MSNTPLKVALVGHGYFAPFHARAWQRLDGADLTSVVGVDLAKAGEFAAQHNITSVHDSVISLAANEPPDIVDIVTPPETHARLIRECVVSGVPWVICQKPFCRDLAEAEELLADIANRGTTVVVHENFRFQPWYQEIVALLDTGVLGTIYEVRFNLRPGDGQGPDAYLERQAYFREQPQLLIRETGVHFIDLFRHLMGEVDGVFARLSRLNPVITGEDAGLVMFEFSNGARGLLNANRLVDHKADNTRRVMGEMTIEGSDATLTLDGAGQIRVRAHGDQDAITHEYTFDDTDFGGDCVHRCCQHILSHITDGSALANRAEDYLVNRRIEALVYASNSEQRWLGIREPAHRYT